ncbi:hypothetical protein [Morganella morganii]|uniref:hypothetical protein n=1 Tax=Morganella morganii TaxID=582 RepID=UPI001BDB8300|nr:hypothetical protein [Morganella morganii]MBT0497618.1 hypothetical protein [Morganella morganii subsp. morganii]QWL97988.1 hypothetical protein IZ183_05720 [Morganella morganii subsp. morganii]HDU8716955.1 hypothetical protein [Morganella morganii subsp. morganii]
MTEVYEHASIRVEMASDATIRDYFAAKAMQGLLSDPDAGMLDDDMSRWAMLSYKMADAMLRAREK